MADELTVKSSPAGAARPARADADDSAAGARLRHQIDELKAKVRSQRGRALSDAQAAAILKRRDARDAIEREKVELKQAFESSRAGERLTHRSEDAQIRAQRAAGTQEARGADGLTPEQRRAVASDAHATPVLPPAGAPPATPEQARAVLDKAFGFIEIEGQKVDLAAYAASVKAKATTRDPGLGENAMSRGRGSPGAPSPDAPPRAAAERERTGGARGAPAASRASSGGAPTRESRPGAGTAATPQRQPARPEATRDAGAHATSGPLSSPAAAARLAFSAAAPLPGAQGTTARAGDTGALSSTTTFDGMRFNWDAFFSLFLIRAQDDLHKWRRMMKELRRLSTGVTLAGYDLAVAMLKLRVQAEKDQALLGLTRSVEGAVKGQQSAKAEGPLAGLFGVGPRGAPRTGTEMIDADRQWDELAAREGWTGRAFATKLASGDPRLLAELERLPALQRLAVLAEAAQHDPGLRADARHRELSDGCRREVEGFVRDVAGSGPFAVMRLQEHIDAVRPQLGGDGEPRTRVAMQLFSADQALITAMPRGNAGRREHLELANAGAGEAAGRERDDLLLRGLGRERPAGGGRLDDATLRRLGIARDRFRALVVASLPDSRTTAADASHDWSLPPADADELTAALAAQHAYMASDKTLKALRFGAKVGEIGDAVGKVAEMGAGVLDPTLRELVESGVQRAIQLARENTGALDTKLRETMSSAQGLLNQLAQLLRAGRAR